MERIRFIFTEALVIWAYACMVNAYHAAAAAIALLAAAYTSAAFTKKEHLEMLPALAAVSLIGLLLIRSCSLQEYLPSLGIVMICGCHVSMMQLRSSFEEKEGTVRILLISGMIFTVLAMLVPSDVFGIRELLTLMLLIFGPAAGMYLRSLLKEETEVKSVAGKAAMR